MSEGKIIIITAPSGSGKTTLVKRLLGSSEQLAFSISACTRQPRPTEQHGRDYYFYSEAEFQELVKQEAFIEWEMVYTGKYYGTLRSELERIWKAGKTPLVDIDVKGALAIRDAYPDSSLTIFIQAPSVEILRKRLEHRGTETVETLEERVSKAVFELSFSAQFDKILINDDLDEASRELAQTVEDFIDPQQQA